MKNLAHSNPPNRSRGITLVEILLIIALLVILLSFAMPSVGGAAARAEMTATVENVQHSMQSARKMARMNEAPVSVIFDAPAGMESGNITFESKSRTGILDYALPEDVMLIADQDAFLFDERGLVQNPGKIILVSRVDETISTTLEVK